MADRLSDRLREENETAQREYLRRLHDADAVYIYDRRPDLIASEHRMTWKRFASRVFWGIVVVLAILEAWVVLAVRL